MDVLPAIKARLKELPESPGVYLMKDAQGEIIYIGKARVLKNRVRSYFNKTASNTHRAASLLRPLVADIEWVITETEMDALVLEATLIPRHKPRFNVRQKDDKHYPYIMVTVKEDFPRVKVVRRVRNDGNRYFGPYTNVRGMRRLLELFPKWFQIRECDLKLPERKLDRPCINYEIGRCDAPCTDFVSSADYKVKVDRVLRFLQGRRGDIIREMQEQMQQKANEKKFEEAAKLRDQILAIQETMERQRMDLSDAAVRMDVVGWARSGTQAVAVVTLVREGLVVDRKHFPLECGEGIDNSEMLQNFLTGLYSEGEDLPDHILVPEEPEDLELIEEMVANRKTEQSVSRRKTTIQVPQRGEKAKLLRLSTRNAEMLLVEQIARAQSFSEVENSVFTLQKELGLSVLPRRVEGFDISHLGGTRTVASMVSFWNGRPDKKNYRHFKVKTVEGIDDFASMNEVVLRRYRRLVEEKSRLPDLILIDGGKGQVSSARRALLEAGVPEIAMIGLAKREEEVIFPDQKESVILSRRSPALKLLQRIRDEAHRFAITHQRSSRKKDLSVDWLQIEGIGPTSRKKILQVFHSPKEVLEADQEILVKMIGENRAELLLSALQGK